MAEVRLEDAPQGVRAYYDKGIAAMERGNLEYAMDMFELALGIEPRLLQVRKLLRAAAVKKAKAHPPAKLAVAKAMPGLLKISSLIKKDALQAIAASEKLLRIDPLNLKFAKAQCDAAERAGLPEIGILTLGILADNAPPALAVLEPLAKFYRTTEQFDLEYKCREQISRLKPTDTEALKELKDSAARLTMGKAGWQKAESYRDVMRENATGTRDERELLLAKIEAEPGNLNYRTALADLLLRGKDYEQALSTLEQCQELAGAPDPQIEQKLLTAKELLLSSRLAEAEDADDREKVAELRKQLADMRMENTARQVERYPNDLQLKFDFGKLLFESGRHTEAIQQFQQAQRNPQRRTRALLYLAKAFKAKEQPAIAREQLENALAELPTLDETKKEVLYELGELCMASGDADQAEQCFRQIYAVDITYRDVAKKVEGNE